MIESYFRAEKQGAFIALAIGIAACYAGGSFLMGAARPFYTGLAIPLLLFGILQIAVGTAVARRSDRQAEDLEKLRAESPAEFRKLEMTRMAIVMRNFVLLKWGEAAVIIIGLALIFLNAEASFAKGLGIGMFAQGAILLVFDFFAEKRGRLYTEFVRKQ